jgi:16S rRNA (guanine527-N7)-methyltransferase
LSTPKVSSESAGATNALWRMADWAPDLSASVMEQLSGFHGELLKFNSRVNLISRATEREADEVHIVDCVLAIKSMAKIDLGASIVDIGAGNGMPGIIMAIMFPSKEIVLLESDSRKCEFLKHVVGVLKLQNVKIMNTRLETLKQFPVKTAVTRGFASVSKTCLMCNRTLAMGSKIYHFKGNSWSSEIAEIPSQLISVWTPELVGEYTLPVSQARRAIVCTTKRS